jgi:hypothetical protein
MYPFDFVITGGFIFVFVNHLLYIHQTKVLKQGHV